MAPPEGDSETVARIARILVDATHPVIAVDRAARNQEGMDLLVKLAESLNAPVIDLYGRMNFPTTHYLQQSARRGALIKKTPM
ncbi:hypothetical protein ACFS07_34380 [Undibacterium arcticum]